jgi:threonine dehydrogenase-like Zn-dependent dehydrogenase
VDFDEAALLEPMTVTVNAVRRADVRAGDNVVVFGAGPIGLLTLQVANVHGAAIVCVTGTFLF